MTPDLILQIIRLSLEIVLEVIKGIPIEQRQEMWKAHEKRMKFWEDLFEKTQKGPVT
jgi:hypothetical protein